MQKTFALLLGVLLVMPLHAQEETADPTAEVEAPVADEAEAFAEAAPADTAEGEVAAESIPVEAADTASTEGEAPADDPFATADASSEPAADSSDPFADSSEASGESEETAEPSRVYVGLAYDSMTFSASTPDLQAKFGGQEFSGLMVHGRAGWRVHDMVALEFQGGVKAINGVDPGTVQVTNYLGVFVVPTGNLFDVIEVSAPIGFNSFALVRGQAKEKFQRVSFGVNLELPVRVIKPTLPDLRFSAGYKAYATEKDSRVYGYHAGMRWDFTM